MSTQPTALLDLDVVETRHHQIADPAACGTCWRLALAGQPTEHPACARRAVLLPAPDAPDYEDLADLTDEQKAALPARFHTPVWEGNAVPHSWVCAVCWGDGWVTRWPCAAAVRHGDEVFTPEHQATRAREDVPALLARVRELEAALARATRSSYSGRHVWEAWAEEGDRTLCTTEADARAAAIQIWSEAEYDGSDHPDGFIPSWHETKWGLELLDDGEHTSVFIARQDVFGTHPDENAPSGPTRPEAPTLTGWAADMAEAGLEPYDGTLTLDADDKPFLRVHLAFAADATDQDRQGFTTQLGHLILGRL